MRSIQTTRERRNFPEDIVSMQSAQARFELHRTNHKLHPKASKRTKQVLFLALFTLSMDSPRKDVSGPMHRDLQYLLRVNKRDASAMTTTITDKIVLVESPPDDVFPPLQAERYKVTTQRPGVDCGLQHIHTPGNMLHSTVVRG